MKRTFIILPLVVLMANFSSAQTPVTEHVVRLDEGATRPMATLDDIAWLAGAWMGEAFGGRFEEVWTRPSLGSMVGLFKLMNDGAVSIYEIQTITEEEGSLLWKVKHFAADFTAWEEKGEFVHFPLVKLEEGAAYFDGLTLIREDDKLVVYLAASTHGATREEKLVYMPMNL